MKTRTYLGQVTLTKLPSTEWEAEYMFNFSTLKTGFSTLKTGGMSPAQALETLASEFRSVAQALDRLAENERNLEKTKF